MRFAHLADCHIGSWRDPKLKNASTKAFIRATNMCMQEEVDFILISGDLFNTSLPSIDRLKEVTLKLRELKENNIPVYIIAGSHDFSPSGKTMLDVLENAGLLINVVKGQVIDNKLKLNFTLDRKTGVKITGLLGKKGMLDKTFYENLIKDNLEESGGYKIFMFHTALQEFKPEELKNMEAHPLSLLPKNFNYYAGGHVHYIFQKQVENYGLITYPGALFPANFAEMEKYGNGGFYIVTENNIEYKPVMIHNTYAIKVHADHKTPEEVKADILEKIEGKEFNNTIVTIRVTGTLESGKVKDINFHEIFQALYQKSAFFVMKNSSQLNTPEFEEIAIDTSNTDEIENKMIEEHVGQIKTTLFNVDREKEITRQLIQILNQEKNEGERNADFVSRIKDEFRYILGEVYVKD